MLVSVFSEAASLQFYAFFDLEFPNHDCTQRYTKPRGKCGSGARFQAQPNRLTLEGVGKGGAVYMNGRNVNIRRPSAFCSSLVSTIAHYFRHTTALFKQSIINPSNNTLSTYPTEN